MYNPLNKLVRRIGMATLNITVAMALLAIGFVLFTWGIDSADTTARNAGGLLILLALLCLI